MTTVLANMAPKSLHTCSVSSSHSLDCNHVSAPCRGYLLCGAMALHSRHLLPLLLLVQNVFFSGVICMFTFLSKNSITVQVLLGSLSNLVSITMLRKAGRFWYRHTILSRQQKFFFAEAGSLHARFRPILVKNSLKLFDPSSCSSIAQNDIRQSGVMNLCMQH